MNEQRYQSALSHLRIDEAFEEKTVLMLLAEQKKQNDDIEKRKTIMEKTKRNTILKLSGGLAACAVFAVCVVSVVQMLKPADTVAPEGSTPAIHAKVMVNIEGEITAVSDDGKSFQIGDLLVTIDENTRFGSPEPTASTDETLLSKEFKVGNLVAGYTADDVTTGKVTADTIYNNMVPEK